MNKYDVKKITENKWFSLYDKTHDLTEKDFLCCVKDKSKLYILIQFADKESVGIYGIIKGKGLFGFTTEKNNFFCDECDVKLKFYNQIRVFLINNEQSLATFIECLDKFLKDKKDVTVEFVYYQDELDNLIKI